MCFDQRDLQRGSKSLPEFNIIPLRQNTQSILHSQHSDLPHPLSRTKNPTSRSFHQPTRTTFNILPFAPFVRVRSTSTPTLSNTPGFSDPIPSTLFSLIIVSLFPSIVPCHTDYCYILLETTISKLYRLLSPTLSSPIHPVSFIDYISTPTPPSRYILHQPQSTINNLIHRFRNEQRSKQDTPC